MESFGVSAINASELQVTFSGAVDEDTAKAKANYDLKINNLAITSSDILDIALSKDGKVATILLDQAKGFQNGDKYVIQTNDNIKSASGEKLEKFVSTEKTFSETAAPSLISTKWDNDKLVFTFDRPVDASHASTDITLVKVDGVEIGSQDLKPVKAKAISGADADILGTAGVYEYEIAITNATARAEAKKLGNHEVVIFDVNDTATSTNPATASVLTGSYTVTDEVIAPKVVGIEAVNANRIFVETNTTVTLDADTVVKVEKGSHEFPADTTQFDNSIQTTTKATSDSYVGSHNGKPGVWVIVTNYDATDEDNPLYRSGESSANLTVTVEKYQANGLIGSKSVQNVTMNKNNTKPVVDTTVLKEGTGTAGADELVVKFTDALDTTALTEGTDYVVRNKDGVIVEDFTAIISGKNITLENSVAAKQDLKDAPYTVELKADKFKNAEVSTAVNTYLVNTVKNDAITVSVGKDVDSSFKYKEFTFAASDAGNNAGVDGTGKYHVDEDNNTITFKYPEKMGNSARDVANYTLDGAALPKGTTVDFVGDKETVRIVLPKGTFKTSTKYKLGITTNVKTEVGSMIVGSLQTKAPAELVFQATDNIKPELASAFYYVGTEDVDNQTKTTKIEVTFSEAINMETILNDAADDFAVVINGSKYDVSSVAEVTTGKDADKKLVLTLGSEINVSQAATITIVPEDDQVDTTMGVLDDAKNPALEGSKVTLKANDYKYNAGYAAELAGQAGIAQAKAALDTKIANATGASTGKTEGVVVGDQVNGSGATLTGAIAVAQGVHDNPASTAQQLTDATTALDNALTAYNTAVVEALIGLNDIAITGTADDSTNTVVLATGETLALTSSDSTDAVATVTEDPAGTIKVTGVAAGAVITITAEVKNAAGAVIKTGTFTVTVS